MTQWLIEEAAFLALELHDAQAHHPQAEPAAGDGGLIARLTALAESQLAGARRR